MNTTCQGWRRLGEGYNTLTITQHNMEHNLETNWGSYGYKNVRLSKNPGILLVTSSLLIRNY